MSETLRIATDEAAERITRFHAALKQICDSHDVQLATAGDMICIFDTTRDNSEFPFVAWIDKDGEMEFDELHPLHFPQEYADLAEAKCKGVAW